MYRSIAAVSGTAEASSLKLPGHSAGVGPSSAGGPGTREMYGSIRMCVFPSVISHPVTPRYRARISVTSRGALGDSCAWLTGEDNTTVANKPITSPAEGRVMVAAFSLTSLLLNSCKQNPECQ